MATKGEKEIKTDYPVVDGIIAGTTTQKGHKMQLEPQGHLGIKTIVQVKERAGMQ